MGMALRIPYGIQKPMDSGLVACHVIQAVTEHKQTLKETETMEHKEIMDNAVDAAKTEAVAILNKWWGGKDIGACGFAWVNIKPKHKGNTKAGRAERVILKEMGFSLDWTGKEFTYWNPSELPVQNVDSKYAGAMAAAQVLREHGFDAYAGSRLD